MCKYEINVTKTQELTLIVEANSYEEARAIYESGEDIAEDYECTGGAMRLDTIVKVAN
jgi:hypothetical protein